MKGEEFLEDDSISSSSPLTNSSPDIVHGHLINNLAPEILGEIFIRCLPYPSNPTSFKDAPLLLLQVCRHWRQTARDTPHLWTDVHLRQKFMIPPAKVFQIWLENSGSLPLKVRLPEHAKNPKQAVAVVELLLDNFHRISELRGSLTPSFSSILLGHTLPIRAPFLKSLSVGGWDKLPSLSDLERLRKCMIVPQLEVCNLNTSRFQLSLLNLDPTRLRKLDDLWVMEVAEFESMDILSTFTTLESLSMFLHSPLDASVLKIPTVIPIPSLRYLHIATFPDYDPNVFLKALDVPFIENLRLYSSQIGSSPLGPILEALTGGNIPPLKSLALGGFNITASEHLPWIRKFTQLQELTLTHGKINAEALIHLTCDSSSSHDPWICSDLSTLHLKLISFPWKAMEGLVRSRAPGGGAGGSLRKVIFEACEDLDVSHREAFTTIQEDSRGQIQIEYMPDQTDYFASD